MSAIKEEVIEMINNLPGNATLEDIQYHLYVLEKIRKGQESIKHDKGISNEGAKKRLSKWLSN